MKNSPTNLNWIGLGTAQFGFNYGITNQKGQVPIAEVESILSLAKTYGITYLDTAPAYGCAEECLGKLPIARDFKIVTKVDDLSKNIDKSGRTVEKAIRASLKTLNRENVYGLLLHSADNLRGHDADDIYASLGDLKEKGLVNKIGISAYDSEQIKAIVSKLDIDLIQIPYNVFNQSLKNDGTLELLKTRSIEIHCRSVFLQGLLLQDPNQVPESVRSLTPYLSKFRSWCESNGLTPLQASLKFLKQEQIDCCLVGVTSTAEMNQLAQAVSSTTENEIDFSQLHIKDTRLTDPRLWTK